MKKFEKLLAITLWFILTYILNIFFQKIFIKYLDLSESLAMQLSLIPAIIITAMILNAWIKKIFMEDIPRIVDENSVAESDKALQIFISARSEWNLYALRSQDTSSPFLWLARKQIDWAQPLLSISNDDKLFLLQKVRQTDRKIEAILDDPELKIKFCDFLEKSWKEQVLNYSILLESKKQFLELSTEERFELLENRDVLEILNEYLVKFNYKNAEKLFEDIEFEDNILREFSDKYIEKSENFDESTNNKTDNLTFTVAAHNIEIKMRPNTYWWWKAAEHGLDDDKKTQIQKIQ